MKYVLIIIALLALAAVTHAAGYLPTAGSVPIQGFAPDGRLSQTLTVSSTTVEMTGAAWGVYCPSDAKLRLLPAAGSTKSSYPQATIPGGSWLVRVTSATSFVNISGCTSGHLQRQ